MVGFCMGGGLAIVVAAARPDAVAACVPFYGLIPWPDAAPDFSAMSASVLGHYAGKDEYFTPRRHVRSKSQLKDLGKDVNPRLRRRGPRVLQRHPTRGLRRSGRGERLDPHDRFPPQPPRLNPMRIDPS